MVYSKLHHGGNLILHIFNRCLARGVFPNRLILDLVIFKAGDPTLLTNYRPISLLNVISKLIEMLVYRRTLNILFHNNLLSDPQFGFRHNRSTEQAIYNFVNRIQSWALNTFFVSKYQIHAENVFKY